MISVGIHTYNNQDLVEYAIRSVIGWADEVVVIDMHSEDGTQDIVRRSGAKLLLHPYTGNADAARQWGLEQTRGDWFLSLDADEVVPQKLGRELQDVAQQPVDIVTVPRINYVFGDALRFGDFAPRFEAHSRFFRRGWLRFDARLHHTHQPRPGARWHRLAYRPDAAILHFNAVSQAQFIAKINHYTSTEADQAFAAGRRPSWPRALYRTSRELLRGYVWRAGYRDGWRGAFMAASMCYYRAAVEWKLRERWAAGQTDQILDRYRRLAEQVLKTSPAPQGPATSPAERGTRCG